MRPKNHVFWTILMATVFMMSSCSSPTALLEKGNYDASVVEAIKKLRKKKKKRKHVEVVEEAFRKVTRQDMARIAALKAEGRPSNWVAIHRIAQDIQQRQALIEPHLPLYAKDGYKADFQFVKTAPILYEARQNAAAYYYAAAKNELEKGRLGQKYAARKAYSYFGNIGQYYDNYQDAAQLRQEALALGINHVLFTMENQTRAILPPDFEEDMMRINVQHLNSKWTKFYSDRQARTAFDYGFEMKLRDMEVSPELVRENRTVERKEIQDGWEYVLDQNGNVLKDSLGNDVKTERYIWAEAWVMELQQHKSATLYGRLVFKDLNTNELLRNENIQVTAVFENTAVTFEGDRRALSPATCNRLGSLPLPFPTDEALIFDALENLKPAVRNQIDDCAEMASL